MKHTSALCNIPAHCFGSTSWIFPVFDTPTKHLWVITRTKPLTKKKQATSRLTLIVEVFHNSQRNRNRKCIRPKIHQGEPRGEKKEPWTRQYKNTTPVYKRHATKCIRTSGWKGRLKMRQCCKCIHQKHDVQRWTKQMVSVFYVPEHNKALAQG